MRQTQNFGIRQTQNFGIRQIQNFGLAVEGKPPSCNRTNTIQYFLGYKSEFSFQNNPKNLDQSYKMDLDLWHCFGRVKLVL